MQHHPSAPIERAVAVFNGQFGAASDRQVRSAGVTWEMQRTLLAKGIWTRYAPGVLLDGGAPPSWHQQAMAATLLPGARVALAAGAAGRVHQLDGCLAVNEITVVIPNSSRVRPPGDVDVLRSRLLTADDIVTVGPLRVASIPLTLLQLEVHGPNVEQALDDALRQGTTAAELKRVFNRWRKCGVVGPAQILGRLHERVDARLPLSWFQRLAARILADEGIQLVDEWPVHDPHGRLVARLDLADPALRVGVECQSWVHHGSPAAQRADNIRKRRVRALGWEIVDVWWSDLDRMDDVVHDITIAFDRARAVRRAGSLAV